MKKRKIRKKKQNKRWIKKVRAVIYDVKNGEIYFLILHRVLRWKGWETLKETLEKGETPLKALKRGILEETGIENFRIIRNLKEKEKWSVKGNNYFITDTFLVRADMNQKISLKQEIIEHDNYIWVSQKEAVKKITWPKTKKLFKKVKINGE